MIAVICMVLHICDDVIFSIVIYEINLWNYIFEYGKFFLLRCNFLSPFNLRCVILQP